MPEPQTMVTSTAERPAWPAGSEGSHGLAQGWGLSLALHAVLGVLVFWAMPKMTPVVKETPFRWEVSLVAAPQQAKPAQESPVQPPAPPKTNTTTTTRTTTPPARPRPAHVQPTPPVMTREVRPQHRAQPVQRESRVVQRMAPVEQVVPLPTGQPLAQTIEQPVAETGSMDPVDVAQGEVRRAAPVESRAETTIVEAVAASVDRPAIMARATPAAVEASAPVVQTESAEPTVERLPVIAANVSAALHQPVAVVESVDAPVVTEAAALVERPVVTPIEQASPPVQQSEPVPQPVPELRSSDVSSPVAVASATTAQRPAAQADFHWLADSLHRRLIEVRHYPHEARLKGWEGKVVLRVTLRQDGHLEQVFVVKSSGYGPLDEAAMEAVRRACPLHLRHEITAPMVVVHVPISYSLNQ